MDVAGDAGNSPLPFSQEGEHDPTQQESCNPPINVESMSTPQGVETRETLETTAQTDAQTEAETDVVKKDRRKSIVWKHFGLMMVNGLQKAQCNYCKKLLGGSSRNGTKHLLSHMDTCVPKKMKERGSNSKGQSFLMPKIIQGKQELGAGTYDAENARKELAHAIIMHDYPLSIVDHCGFKRYSAALQPLFQVPSRNTIKKEIFKVYEYERSTTMKLLDSLQGRVAITSDMWTSSNQKRGYMAVTAHYIDESWTLQSHVLSEYPENEWHLFFGCSKAQLVWEEAGLWNLIRADFEQADGANQLFFQLLQTLDNDVKTDFAAVIWCLWRRRNDMVWNSNDRPVCSALHEARSFIAAWQFYRKPDQHGSQN